MKRTAMQHTKLKKLMRILGVPQYAAVGILESLWHLCAREAPMGNIGKLADEDIAVWMDWDRQPDELVAALVACGWVDASDEFRLVIHDWEEHCDDATKKMIQRKRPEMSGNVRQKPRAFAFALPEPEPCLAGEGEQTPPPAPDPPGPVLVTTPPADPLAEIPDGLTTVEYTRELLAVFAIVGGHSLQDKFSRAITTLSNSEGVTLAQATQRMAERMRGAGDVKWAFWLEDDGWKQRPPARASPAQVGVWDGKPASPPSEEKPISELMGESWCQGVRKRHSEGKLLGTLEFDYMREVERARALVEAKA